MKKIEMLLHMKFETQIIVVATSTLTVVKDFVKDKVLNIVTFLS